MMMIGQSNDYFKQKNNNNFLKKVKIASIQVTISQYHRIAVTFKRFFFLEIYEIRLNQMKSSAASVTPHRLDAIVYTMRLC